MQLAILVEEEDAEQLVEAADMGVKALRYLQSFTWYPGAIGVAWATGIPGVCGVFYIRLQKAVGGDIAVWVVVGDLPSAYLVVNEAEDGIDALRTYIGLMEDWCGAAENGADLGDVYPVDAAPTPQNVDSLRDRLKTLRGFEKELKVSRLPGKLAKLPMPEEARLAGERHAATVAGGGTRSPSP